MPGAEGPKTVKGAQSGPNYVSRLLARSECLPGGPNYSYATDTINTILRFPTGGGVTMTIGRSNLT